MITSHITPILFREMRIDHTRFSETAEASNSRHHGSTSRLFDNGVSIFSPGTRDEVGQHVQGYEGEISSLHTWAFYDAESLMLHTPIIKNMSFRCKRLICFM